jgi:citrate lyase subunit beta / citryl-CoA lyase
MLEKARSLDVDEVVIDLEDSVPPEQKTDRTRRLVADALREDWRTGLRAVRVNAPETPWFHDDLRSLSAWAGHRIGAVVVPKVESAETVVAVDGLLSELGLAHVALEVQIESAQGLLRVEEIAAASPRLEALVFGPGDYAASLGIPQEVLGGFDPDYPGDQWHYARSRIAVAAHANGLQAVDGPYGDYRDRSGLLESARRARVVGFTGKWVIHPFQVEPCMHAFAPTAGEVEAATRVIAALDAAARDGRGAAEVDGRMVDEASRRHAAALLSRADASIQATMKDDA